MTRVLANRGGSLARSQRFVDRIFARVKGELADEGTWDAIRAAAIDACVAALVAAGLNIDGDGGTSKTSWGRPGVFPAKR